MDKVSILVVEDNLLVSTAVQDILQDSGYHVDLAETGKDASALLKKGDYRLVVLDMMLPDTTGQKLLPKWIKEYPEQVTIVMTAHADVPTAVQCLKLGAYDFLTKPVEKDVLLKTIEKALEHSQMAKKVTVLTELTKHDSAPPDMTNVIAESKVMTKTMEMLKLVAQSDFSCILIQGESGTGKGLLARTIHQMASRSSKPFVEVNCSALPANLIESELFGHKKGAFTDAKEDKIGLFEMADTGTLFLDEIGDMDINLQAKLLKVMEEQKFRRIGATQDISVDVAIIAATNQNVEQLVADNKFREDLYFRLNVIPIQIPPLRDRMEDIPALSNHFLRFFSRKFGKDISGFGDKAVKLLNSYSWPGNVREFRNVVERACILTQENVVDDPEILFPAGARRISVNKDEVSIPAMPLSKAEELVIRAAMEEAQGNKNKAASILGLHRTTLYKKLEEYNIATSD